MSTFLVLGGSGFIGIHLVRSLLRSGHAVTSVARSARDPNGDGVYSQIAIDVCRQFEEVKSVITRLRPAYIINLIGGRRRTGLEDALFTYRLGRFLAEDLVSVRLVLAGSAAEYGFPASLPVDETHPLRPISEYGFVKVVQAWVARAVHDECGLPVLVARIFNVIGPGQSREYLVGSVVAQAVDMMSGSRRTVDVGAVNSVRDFVDVRDVARALELIARYGRAGEAYNVCCGQPLSVRDVLQKVGEFSGFPGDFYTVVPSLNREEDPVIYGSNRKIAQDTDWKPSIDIDRTLQDMIVHEKVSRLKGSVEA